MKSVVKFLSLSFLFVSIQAVADDLPSRKPGLWQIDMVGTGGQSMKQCIDAATDKAMMEMGQDMAKKMGGGCSKNEILREGEKVIINAECTFAQTKMISKTEISGDFNSKYTTVTSTKYDPPFMGQSSNEMRMTATWLGACAADQQPGDMIMANGMKMNMNAMKTMTR